MNPVIRIIGREKKVTYTSKDLSNPRTYLSHEHECKHGGKISQFNEKFIMKSDKSYNRINLAEQRITKYVENNDTNVIRIHLRNTYEIKCLYDFVNKHLALADNGKKDHDKWKQLNCSHIYDENLPQRYLKNMEFNMQMDMNSFCGDHVANYQLTDVTNNTKPSPVFIVNKNTNNCKPILF